jgi:hypothetical protein
METTNRRDFIKKTATVSSMAFINPSFIFSAEDDDPVYHMIRKKPDLDHILKLFPRPQGNPDGSKRADYCLPCQLVAARAGRFINKS